MATKHEWSREYICKLHEGDPDKGVEPMSDAAIADLFGKTAAEVSFGRKRSSFWEEGEVTTPKKKGAKKEEG